MSTTNLGSPALSERLKDPLFEAFFLLRTLFTVAPILFGLDKFFNLLTHVPGGAGPSHWDKYLAGWIDDILPGNADQAMLTAQLDNLGKGAAGACVQNLNLMLGLDEAAGL